MNRLKSRWSGEALQDQETVQLFQSMEEGTRIYPVEGTFFGLIQTAYGTERQENDGILQVKGTERVRAIYVDGPAVYRRGLTSHFTIPVRQTLVSQESSKSITRKTSIMLLPRTSRRPVFERVIRLF